MNNKIKLNILIISMLLFLVPLSAFAYKKVKCFVLKPPKKLFIGVERIAVLGFESRGTHEVEKKSESTEEMALQLFSDLIKNKTGKKAEQEQAVDYGPNFTDYLISNLIMNNRGIKKISTGFLGMGSGKEGKTLQAGTFTNIFEIVERDQLNRIIEEQKLSAAGFVNDEQILQLGNMLGVQAFIMGNINYSHKDSKYKSERKKKKNGKKVTIKVDCKKRKVSVTVRAKIVNAETGKILGSTKFSKSEEKSKCEDSYGSLPSVDEMIDGILKKISWDITNYFTPHYDLQSYELEKIKDKKFKKQAEKAAKMAEELKVDEAYIIYKSIHDKEPYNPEAMYNLGIINEVVANYHDAIKFYNMAQQLKDEKKYKKAISRTKKTVAFSEALSKIGIEIKKHSFNVSEAKKAQALAKKVKIKGKRDKRVPVYAQTNSTSEISVKVPRDLSFTVIKREGDWYLLQLLGGKQGYIHKDKVESK